MSFNKKDQYERTQKCPDFFWKQVIYILITYKFAYAKFENKMPCLGHFQRS